MHVPSQIAQALFFIEFILFPLLFYDRSLINKIPALRPLVHVNNYEVILTTETWLSDNTSDGGPASVGYRASRKDRRTNSGEAALCK